MQLNIPDHTPAASEEFPLQPRKIKRWLRALPPVNIGEITRQFYQGLLQANRQNAPPRKRLDSMELMRPTAETVLQNLQKHLLARSFPLPPKTLKILHLQQSLLGEMATGYKLVIHDAVNGGARLDTRSLTLSVHRAMRYLGRQLQTASEVYVGYPRWCWRDFYQLYRLAEHRRILDREVSDTEYFELKRSTILDVFRQVALLALSDPQRLRQGEALKLAAFFEHAAANCRVLDTKVPDDSGNVACVELSCDDPPEYALADEAPDGPDTRYLDHGELIAALRAQIQGNTTDRVRTIVSRATLGMDLYHRLLGHLTTNSKRQFPRVSAQDRLRVVLGLNRIHHTVSEDAERPPGEDTAPEQPADPNLQLAPNTQELQTLSSAYIPPDPPASQAPEQIWDMVGKGNVVTSIGLHRKPGRTPAPAPNPAPTLAPARHWGEWTVVNTSAGGYRLLWDDEAPCSAHVGEVLAMRSPGGHQFRWQTGVVRWMQASTPRGLDVGVELLAPRVLPVLIEYEDVRRRTTLAPLEGLMLPGVKSTGTSPTLLSPVDVFSVGDEVIVSLFDHALKVELTGIVQQTGSFVQFSFSSEETDPGESPPSGDEDFASVWNSL